MSAQIYLVMALDSEQHSYSTVTVPGGPQDPFFFVFFLNSCGSCCSWTHPVSAVGLVFFGPWLYPNSCIPFVSFSIYESPWPIGPFGPVALLVLKLLAILYTLIFYPTGPCAPVFPLSSCPGSPQRPGNPFTPACPWYPMDLFFPGCPTDPFLTVSLSGPIGPVAPCGPSVSCSILHVPHLGDPRLHGPVAPCGPSVPCSILPHLGDPGGPGTPSLPITPSRPSQSLSDSQHTDVLVHNVIDNLLRLPRNRYMYCIP